MLAHGFCRVLCAAGGKDEMVAFCCKRRGFLSVVRGAPHGRPRALRKRFLLDFPLLLCSEPELAGLRSKLGVDVDQLPCTLAIDRQGQHVEQLQGADRTQFAAVARKAGH